MGYEYDTLDRIIRRTLNGSDPTLYVYDKASRPLTITHRGQTTTYTWDNAGRLMKKALANGIQQDYQYDDADRVIQVRYLRSDDTVIETISYAYDVKGQRFSKTSGSLSMQETPSAATYDAANRLRSLTVAGETFNLAYDDSGNLVAKTEVSNPGNVTTYLWDARNRLIGINGPGITASFTYDALNRRSSRTVNGSTLGYVYDGEQAIAEATDGAISATLLTTPEVDDAVASYRETGSRTYLTDALGSVVARAKSDQGIQNFYSYSPYGETTVLGDDEGNAIQYTGRENDGTGLYYYRARYYDPVLKRFLQEDPIGLLGGMNVYAYVRGNPVSFTDPSGLELQCTWVFGGYYDRTERIKVKEEQGEWVRKCELTFKPSIGPPDPTDRRRPRGSRTRIPFPGDLEIGIKCDYEWEVTQPEVWETRTTTWMRQWTKCVNTCTGRVDYIWMPDIPADWQPQ